MHPVFPLLCVSALLDNGASWESSAVTKPKCQISTWQVKTRSQDCVGSRQYVGAAQELLNIAWKTVWNSDYQQIYGFRYQNHSISWCGFVMRHSRHPHENGCRRIQCRFLLCAETRTKTCCQKKKRGAQLQSCLNEAEAARVVHAGMANFGWSLLGPKIWHWIIPAKRKWVYSNHRWLRWSWVCSSLQRHRHNGQLSGGERGRWTQCHGEFAQLHLAVCLGCGNQSSMLYLGGLHNMKTSNSQWFILLYIHTYDMYIYVYIYINWWS